jgi:hypothetical protein
MGGKQPGLELAARRRGAEIVAAQADGVAWSARPIAVPEDRSAAHAAFLRGKVKDALWLKPPFAPGGEA